MIRLVRLIRRPEHVSPADFAAYWRDEHGPLVASLQTRLDILRYTQSHRVEDEMAGRKSEFRGQMEQPYDGVEEMWWAAEDALERALDSTHYRLLVEGEKQFIDQSGSPLWLAHEYPQVNTSLVPTVARPQSSVVKAHFALRHRPELTIDEARRYWLTVHGPLIRSLAPALGLIAYQQVHRFDSPLEDRLRAVHGTTIDPYLGHAEMWFDRSIARRGPELAGANVAAAADESHFIDFARSSTWIGKEHVLVDRW